MTLMHLEKPGLRVLGVAESYRGRHDEGAVSHLAGVVMRRDLRIDGIGFATTTVGGDDATGAVIRLVASLERDDLTALMLSGAVIAWFNVVEADRVAETTGLPVVVVTYEASKGLEGAIARHFPGDAARLERYGRLGERSAALLSNGSTVYIRPFGLSLREAAGLVDAFTIDGRIPEPIRVARLIARGFRGASGSGAI